MSYSIAEREVLSPKDNIVALWQRNFPGRAAAQRYDWLYDSGHGDAWFVENSDGVPIGSTGLSKRTFRVAGHDCQIGQALDMNVDQEHRSVGAAIQLQRQVTAAARDASLTLVFGIPVPQAEAVMRRVGYRPLGCIERWVKPLRSAYKLRERVKPRAAVPLIAPFVDTALKYRSADAFYRRPRHVRIEVTRQFDDRFDTLWEQFARQFNIIGTRDADYQNWRVRDCPDVDYQTFCVVDSETDQLLGNIVFYELDNTLYIVDIMFRDQTACDLLLSEFIRHARKEKRNAVSIAYFGTQSFTDRLRRFGFSQRPFHQKLMIHVNPDQQLMPAAEFLDKENWFFTTIDGDTDG